SLYTLSLHDALPIFTLRVSGPLLIGPCREHGAVAVVTGGRPAHRESAFLAMAAEQRAAPAEQRAEPVAEPGQEHEVHCQPHHPAGEAAEADALELDHGAEPPDRRHAAEVDVLERHRLVTAALQSAPDRAP